MKLIVFLRHGKSDWTAAYDTDHERPLAKRGRRASRRMGRFLAKAGLSPDLIISSTAKRAHDTARIASEAGSWDCALETTDGFYLCDARDVISALRRLPEECERVVVVGHEPTWSEAVSLLIGGGHIRVPTAAMSAVEPLGEAWADLAPDSCRLLWHVPPRLLK